MHSNIHCKPKICKILHYSLKLCETYSEKKNTLFYKILFYYYVGTFCVL